MKKMNKKGFTIVELSIVIAVVAILSAVMIPTFSSIVSNSRNSAAVQEAKNAYTQYLASVEDVEEAAEDFIYEYSEDRVVAINDGQLIVDNNGKVKVYDDRAEALKAIDSTYVEGESATCTVTDTNTDKLSTVVKK